MTEMGIIPNVIALAMSQCLNMGYKACVCACVCVCTHARLSTGAQSLPF